MRHKRSIRAALLAFTFCLGASGAAAEPMTLNVVLAPKDDIRLEFADGSRHVMLTQREGKADGGDAFAGATVVEYGMHDIQHGIGGDARGYLAATLPGGDIAYFAWQLRAVFAVGPDGKTKVLNNGHWELTGGTGQFASMRGVGTLSIEFVNKTDRRYLLEGDLSPAP